MYDMRSRCYNPNSKAYKDYHDRGITICDEWLSISEISQQRVHSRYIRTKIRRLPIKYLYERSDY